MCALNDGKKEAALALGWRSRDACFLAALEWFVGGMTIPGMSILGKQQCRCNGRLVNGVDPKSITRFEVFPPGSICDKVDIIVTMKSGKQICVNPKSKMVKNILSGYQIPSKAPFL
uniref:Chemokine interleukin-8-like domain-containing protein n=1 Tax=Leptobrachium leishanense TaxID=445787 RepID=A0A8C5QNJ6_9ANUR